VIDPTRPATAVNKVWEVVRKKANVQCRFPDLRHTTLTKWAERGVPEGTMLALAGHMSRAMLERYSHIRMQAKREAVEGLTIGKPAAVGSPENPQSGMSLRTSTRRKPLTALAIVGAQHPHTQC